MRLSTIKILLIYQTKYIVCGKKVICFVCISQNQVNRYILWPGQATAYKIGEIKIRELRKKAENSLGRNFDVRDFHHILLRCFGPFTYVEKCVDDFIVKNCC